MFFIGLPLSILLGLLLLLLGDRRHDGHFRRLSRRRARPNSRRTAERERHGRTTSDDTEKTEDPTQKRLDEALKRGDVVKSQEVNTWFIIAGATLVLMAFSGGMGSDLTATMRGLIANSHNISVDGPALPRLFEKIGVEMIAAVAIPFLLLMLAALGGNMIQHRLVWSLEVMTPKLSKISPPAGFKRLFSKQALANFAKGIVKLVLVGTRAHRADVARARPHHGARARRSGGGVAARPVAGAQTAGRRGRHAWRWWRSPITCSNTGSGTSGRKCRCAN